MMDLRQFLKHLEAEGELQKITAPVDAKHEIGGVCKILNERPGSPAVLFENVKGSRSRCRAASLRRQLVAMRWGSRRKMSSTRRQRATQMAPRLVNQGHARKSS